MRTLSLHLSALFHSLAKYFQLWGYLALFYSFLFYIKGLDIKPNNPIIGNTLPMSEIKPINVQMNVTIVMTIISTKYCISPILGTIMSIIMILVIYNTIVGLMYAFASRFTTH
jgi:uncharacterized membrane protein YkvI